MENDTSLLKEIYELQKESNERDTRIESQITYMDQRLTKTEELVSRMGEVLIEQKHINKAIESNQEKLNNHETRISTLEQGPAKKVYKVVLKILGVVLTVTVTAIVTYFLAKLGIKK